MSDNWNRQAELCFNLEHGQLDEQSQPWKTTYTVRETVYRHSSFFQEKVIKSGTFRHWFEGAPEWLYAADRYANHVDYRTVVAVGPAPSQIRDEDNGLWTLIFANEQYCHELDCPERQCPDDCPAVNDIEFEDGIPDEAIWQKMIAGTPLDTERMLAAINQVEPPDPSDDNVSLTARMQSFDDIEISKVLDNYFHRKGHLVEVGATCPLCEEQGGQPHGWVTLNEWGLYVYRREFTLQSEIEYLLHRLPQRPIYECDTHVFCNTRTCHQLELDQRQCRHVGLIDLHQEVWQCPSCHQCVPFYRGTTLNGLLSETRLPETQELLERWVQAAYADIILAAEDHGNYRWLYNFFKLPLSEEHRLDLQEVLRVCRDELVDAK